MECKNALHPAGPCELRNSYEHILKANDHLNLFRDGFADPAFRKQIATKIGRSLPEGTRLVTGILVTNRMLLGLRMGMNAVRSVFELDQFLAEGSVTVMNDVKRFWTVQPTVDDLCQFFDDVLTMKAPWGAMKE